jgi:adenylate cyclase
MTNELRKSKSSLNIFHRVISRSRSRNGLRPATGAGEHPSLRTPPPLPSTYSPFLQMPSTSTLASTLVSIPSPPSVLKKSGKKKKTSASIPEPPPQPTDNEHEFTLDTNLDSMDGIIDLSIHSMNGSLQPSSPSSGFGSSHSHFSDQSSLYSNYNPPLTSADFSNPFLPTSVVDKRKGIMSQKPTGKISPKMKLPLLNGRPSQLDGRSLPGIPLPAGAEPGSPTWTAPESWAVEKVGDDAGDDGASSSDDSVGGGPRRLSTYQGDTTPNAAVLNAITNGTPPPINPKPRKQPKSSRLGRPRQPDMIRIYLANGTFHIVTVPPNVNVANLTPVLQQKLLEGSENEIHRLYLKERGRGTSFPYHLFR